MFLQKNIEIEWNWYKHNLKAAQLPLGPSPFHIHTPLRFQVCAFYSLHPPWFLAVFNVKGEGVWCFDSPGSLIHIVSHLFGWVGNWHQATWIIQTWQEPLRPSSEPWGQVCTISCWAGKIRSPWASGRGHLRFFFPVISFDLLENVPFNKCRVLPVHLMRLVREFLRGPAMWLITKW